MKRLPKTFLLKQAIKSFLILCYVDITFPIDITEVFETFSGKFRLNNKQ